MIFINGVAFEKVFNMVWIVSCTAPLHRTYTIVSAKRQYLCSTYFARWCRHREEMIYTCTYSEMRILQLIKSGTLANAGRPERVTNKQTTKVIMHYTVLHFADVDDGCKKIASYDCLQNLN
jgi:hypothetical protein